MIIFNPINAIVVRWSKIGLGFGSIKNYSKKKQEHKNMIKVIHMLSLT